MKRAELETKLQGIENAKEIIDFVMSENGKDVEALKTAREQAETARKEAEAKLAEYAEFTPEKVEAFKAFNPSEVEELRKYKAENETAQTKSKKEAAVMELLKSNKASDKAAKLLIKCIDLNAVEFDEKGAVKDGTKIIEPLKSEYAEYFTTETTGGATAGNPPGNNTKTDDPFLAGFKQA
jgi:DNA repair exonuclease SbcCD ATPase subunit